MIYNRCNSPWHGLRAIISCLEQQFPQKSRHCAIKYRDYVISCKLTLLVRDFVSLCDSLFEGIFEVVSAVGVIRGGDAAVAFTSR